MTDSTDIISNIIKKHIKAPESGTYEPTVVICGGGTGNLGGRHLSHALSGHEDVFVELVSIDTNLSQNHLGKVPPLSEKQFIGLDPNATLQALNRAKAGDESDQFLLTTVPQTDPEGKPYHSQITAKLEDGAGAGQDGRAGKLSFLSNITDGQNVKVKLEDIRQRLVGLKEMLEKKSHGLQMAPRTRVFIVLSISGGTGRGLAESLPVLCREIFGTESCSITLIAALPGEHLDRVLSAPPIERRQTRANTIGALREIQTYMTEDHSDRIFQFSDRFSSQLGTSAFVNSLWLVSEETLDHVPVDSYDDIPYAIGQFLYGFLASGAGTSYNAGLVNHFESSVGEDDGWGAKICHSFGVASVEMPVDDLSVYGLRRALDQSIQEWKNKSVTESEALADADDFLTAAVFSDYDALCEHIAPSIPESEYLQDDKTLSRELRAKSRKFLSEADSRIKNLPQALESRSVEFAGLVDSISSETAENLDKTVKSLLSKGVDHTQRVLKLIGEQIEEHLNENRTRQADRKKEKEHLSASMTKRQKWISSPLLPFDRGLRLKFIDNVRDFLHLSVNEAVSGHLARCLTIVRQQVDAHIQSVTSFSDEVESLEIQNREEIGMLTEKSPPSSLLTYALPHSEFAAWYEKNPIATTETIRLSDLNRESFVKGALEPVMQSFLSRVRSMKVLEMAEADPKVKNRLLALDLASKPLFGMIKAAPRIESLLPQKFLVGDFSGHEEWRGEFEAMGDRRPTVLDSPNPYVVSVIQTISNFGIGRWRRFAEAMTAYEQDPWRAHVVSDFESFPPLVRRAKDQERSLRTLGLGLMTDAICQRGSRYYINLEEDGRRSPAYRFSGYRLLEDQPETDKRPAAVHLVGQGLVEMPSMGRKAEDLLGDSLEAAVSKLMSPATNGFAGYVESITEELEARIGGVAFRELVRDFVENILEKERAGAVKGSSRQVLLNDTIEVLRDGLAS